MAPLLLLLLLAPAVLPLSGRLDPQTEPTEIARFHSLRDPSLRPSATPNHIHARPHSISVKYFSSAPSSCLLHVPVLSSRLDDFGWPCLTRRPRPSHPEPLVISRRLHLSPRSLFTRRQTSFSSCSCSCSYSCYSSSSSLSKSTPGPSLLNAVLGYRRLLNHTLFANIGTLHGVFVRPNIQRTKISPTSASNNSPAATRS